MTDIAHNKLLKAGAFHFLVINAMKSVVFSDFRLIKCTPWSIPLSLMSKASLLQPYTRSYNYFLNALGSGLFRKEFVLTVYCSPVFVLLAAFCQNKKNICLENPVKKEHL